MNYQQVIFHIGMTLEELEKQAILSAYRFFHNNKTQTAKALDVSVKTIENKIKKYEDDEKAKESTKFRTNQDLAEMLPRSGVMDAFSPAKANTGK